MLSFLSSWFWGCSDDPRIILCRDVVLGDSQAESGDEWVWVDVERCEGKVDKEEDLENVLQEYIIIPPYPTIAKQSSLPPETAVASHKRSKRREVCTFKKKRRCVKLRIYPPLKAPSQYSVRRMVSGGSKRASPRTLPCIKDEVMLGRQDYEQGFSFDSINYKGLQGFHSEGENIPWIQVVFQDINQPRAILNSLPGVMQCSTLALNTKTTLSDSWHIVPEIHTYITDNFNKLSTEGWSILIDSSGETLSSSMVRIWSIRNGSIHNNTSRLFEALCSGKKVTSSCCDDAVALLDKSVVKRKQQRVSSKKRKNRGRKNELTAKPGHTSLIVEKRLNNSVDRNRRNYNQDTTETQIVPAFSLSRGLNSLIHSSRDMLIALQVYLTQILDTVAIDDMSSCHPPRRHHIPNEVAHRNITKKKNGRKNLARWNANSLQRCNKAVSMRRKAMGRGGFNCAVKRAF